MCEMDLPLSEKELLGIIGQTTSGSRQSTILPGLTDEILFDSLLKTAFTTTISANHSSTAIQALFSFVQLRKSEKSGILPTVLFTNDGWLRCLDLLILRSESTKVKLVRHFLDLLLSFLKFDGSPDIRVILPHLFKPLHGRCSRGTVKPSLQTIAMFLSKRILSVETLVNLYALEISEYDAREPSFEKNVERFFQDLFYWAQFHELAPPIGKIASHICSEFSNAWQSLGIGHVSIPWIKPLLEQLRKTPEALYRFKSHVFPELFRHNLDHYHSYLGELGLDLLSPCIDHEKHTNLEEVQINSFDRELLLVALQVGKEIGLVVETDDSIKNDDISQVGRIQIATEVFCRLLYDTSSIARLAGLSLIITSTTTTKPFSRKALKGIKDGLSTLFVEQDAKVRQDTLALLSHMIDRIKAAVFKLSQNVQRLQADQSITRSEEARISRLVVNEHNLFLRWLPKMATDQLYPEAGYQRQVFALKLLHVLLKADIDSSTEPISKTDFNSEKLDISVNIFTPILDRYLRDLLMNPFEDIRSLAASLLASSFQKSSRHFNVVDSGMATLIERAEVKMLQSGRADQADGLAHMYAIIFRYAPLNCTALTEQNWWYSKLDIISHLVNKLERSIHLARQNIARAIIQFPLHGLLLSIRYILDSQGLYIELIHQDAPKREWAFIHQALVRAVKEVWNCVREVLCSDAPEGHLSSEYEDQVNLTTKDILSYSWRALKEASFLIRVLALKATDQKDVDGHLVGISLDELDQMTRLCFDELSVLRHRGAFSSVAQAFASCCQSMYTTGQHMVLIELYTTTLQCIQDRATTITRRSAGIPSLMVGIISADPEGPLLDQAINDLTNQAQDPMIYSGHDNSLPQVHALNTLRSLFTTTTLAARSEPFVTAVFGLAGKSLTSSTWAIRNCGLMLFRALFERLLGNSEQADLPKGAETSMSRLSWSAIPGLDTAMFELLDSPVTDVYSPAAVVESVFPALNMLQKIPPPNTLRQKAVKTIAKLLQSSHWHVRDMAARTYSGLILEGNLPTTVGELLEDCQSLETQNKVHGHLLCARYLIKRLFDLESGSRSDHYGPILQSLLSYSKCFVLDNRCPNTQAAYLDILSSVLCQISKGKSDNSCEVSQLIQEWTDFLLRQVSLYDFRSPAVSSSLYSSTCVALLLCIRFSNENSRCFNITSFHRSLEKTLSNLIQRDPPIFSLLCEEIIPLVPALSLKELRILKGVLLTHSLDQMKASSLPTVDSTFLLISILERDRELPHMGPGNYPSSLIEGVLLKDLVESPGHVEACIRMWSLLLPVLSNRGSFSVSISTYQARDYYTFLRYVRPLLRDVSPTSQRCSIVQALNELSHLRSLSLDRRLNRFIIVEYVFLLYDCLNDDDGEIRDIAATATCRFLALWSPKAIATTLAPLTASTRLAMLISGVPEISSISRKLAIQRMTNSVLDTKKLSPSAVQRLESAMIVDDTALFAAEKQNLYVDEFRESNIWAAVLKKQSPKNKYVEALETWACEGLQRLCDMMEVYPDGALGWSSKPDVFILATQLINTADVILSWPLTMNQNKSSRVMEGLAQLAQACNDYGLHETILEKTNHVLEKAVLSCLSRTVAHLEFLMQAK